jgi:hypothetical protein
VLIKLAAQDELVMEVWRTLERLGPDQHVICVHVCTATSRRSIKQKKLARALMPRPITYNSAEGSGAQDIVLNTSQSSVPECVERATRLVRASRQSRTVASKGMLDSLLHQTDAHSPGIPGTVDEGIPRVLDVEVGRDRMRLFGVRSNEQAIAEIEQRLSGKVGCVRVRGSRYPLPPDLM